MKVELRVNMSKNCFQKLSFLAGDVPMYSVKAFGTIYARALAAATPPHKWGSPVSVLRTQKHEDIKILQERIAWNIAGVDSPADIEGFAQPVPYRNLPGQWLAIDPETRKPVKPRGFFGFVVPISWRKVKGKRIPETSPERVGKAVRWDGSKLWSLTYKRVKFVRKNALKAYVKKRQKDAGHLISGWAFGARVFALGGKIDSGFFEHLKGKGFGRIYTDKKGRSRGVLVNRQSYQPEQAKRIESFMQSVVRRTSDSRAAQILKIKKWYAQQAKKVLGVN